MPQVSVRLSGPFQITRKGQVNTEFETAKVRALLVRPAAKADQPHQHKAPAKTLWPNQPKRAAQTNLRHALSNHNPHLSFLPSTQKSIQFDIADGPIKVQVSNHLRGQTSGSNAVQLQEILGRWTVVTLTLFNT